MFSSIRFEEEKHDQQMKNDNLEMNYNQ